MPTTVDAVNLPFEEAISFFRQKANVGTRSHRDVWGAAHSKAFMVSGAMSDALVQDFRNEIDKALAEGTTLADFRTGFDDIVAKHGWQFKGGRDWRTKIIFDTNMRTAHAAGRYAQLTKPGSLTAFPYWQYNHSGAVHPRRNHLSWNGTVLPANDPFWDTNYPPNGYHCGCFVTPVSGAGLRRQGKSGPDPSPNLERLDGGSLGADPGFDYNPGKAWFEQTAPGPQAVTAGEAEVAAFVRSALAGKRPAESWTPIATVGDELATILDVPAKTEIRLSADTIVRHTHHPEATPAAYGIIPRILIEKAPLYRRSDGRLTFFDEIDGRLWNAGIKVVRADDGSEIWFLTLFHGKERNLLKLQREAEILRE